jgi:N-acetylglutamate synthase
MTPAALFAAMEATWPPVSTRQVGPFLIREGRGAGGRVSAGSALGPVTARDLPLAEAAMRALGQVPLFLIRADDRACDALLAEAGYALRDPTIAYTAPVSTLVRPLPPQSTFAVWPPLAVQAEIWAEGGVGPARFAVMDRAAVPKTALLARSGDRAAGVAFVAVHEGIAMLHAVEVRADLRRKGVAHHLIAAAANWAAERGAMDLALLVTKANLPARALYASAGMRDMADYHYRVWPE